ncbi:MAG TPA: hypothetical protein VIN59_04150 [Alphaproteobacteria bacterium]
MAFKRATQAFEFALITTMMSLPAAMSALPVQEDYLVDNKDGVRLKIAYAVTAANESPFLTCWAHRRDAAEYGEAYVSDIAGCAATVRHNYYQPAQVKIKIFP